MSHEPARKRGGPPTAAQVELENFWTKAMEDIKNLTPNDLKAQADLPLARIKKIMKLDDDVKMISAEAPVVFAKAAEIFIHELTLRAWIQAEEGKRRTLQRSDIAQAIAKCDQFDFLIDIVPREEIKPAKASQGDAKPAQVVQEQLLYNVQVGSDGTLLAQQAVQAHPQLMQIPGLSGLAAQVGQQPTMQTVQILGPNGQLQTVALVGGAALGLQAPDQNGEPQMQRQIQIPAGFQLVNQGGGPQIIHLQQPSTGPRPQSPSNPQAATPTGVAQASAAGQNVQILQQVIGPNGEIQHIPVSLTAAQLQSFRPQAPSVGLSHGSHQVVHLQQVNPSAVSGSPVFMQHSQATPNG